MSDAGFGFIAREANRLYLADCERLEAEALTMLRCGFTPDELLIRSDAETGERQVIVKPKEPAV